MDKSSTNDLQLDEKTSPPMANGELIFESPWEGRVFGMARALCEKGEFEWDEFREYLISEISSWEAKHNSQHEYHYYELFFQALQKLLAKKQICATSELNTRTTEYAHRPSGHDH